MQKKDYPLGKVYSLLEPGPTVLVSTRHKGKANVMTNSWHTMMEFEPPLIGCVISNRNLTFSMLKASKQCVINIPTVELAETVIAVGNVSGRDVEKFEKFGLIAEQADIVDAPLIAACYANLECRLVDTAMVKRYCFFVLEVVKGWIDPKVKDARTIHHEGYGNFMVAGERRHLQSKMR